jgi:hypothetical protein
MIRDMPTRRVFTALIVLLLGCGAPPRDSPASEPATETAPAPARASSTRPATTSSTTRQSSATTQSRRPVPETFTVDLAVDYGPFKPLAKGLHRLTPTVRPTPEMMQALKPLLDEPTPTLITLGNTVKFDGAFPGEKANWSKWEDGVRELVRRHQGHPVQWEIWDEPDRRESFKGNREDFFSVWVRTYQIIRAIDSGAVLVGPSISKYDGGYVQEFLKITKDYRAQATIVSWHEEGTRPDIPGHLDSVGENFWQDGTIRPFVRVAPKASEAQRYSPSDPVMLLHPMHSAQRRAGWRGTGYDFSFKLTHLITDKPEPRSLYHAYAAYAGLDRPGNREVRTAAGATTDGVAVWNASRRQGAALIGRNFNRAFQNRNRGAVTLEIRGVRGTHLRVDARRLDDSGSRPSNGPVVIAQTEIPVSRGEASLVLREFGDRDAYFVTFIAVDKAPTTTTAPSSRPASSTTTTTAPSR